MATFYRPTMISSSSSSSASSSTITRFRANLFTPQRQPPQHNNLPLAFPTAALFPKGLKTRPSSSPSFTFLPNWSAFRGLRTGTSLGNAGILTHNSFQSTAAVSASQSITSSVSLKPWVAIVLVTILFKLITLPISVIEEKLNIETASAFKMLKDIKDPDTTLKVFEEITMKKEEEEEGYLVMKQEYKVIALKTILVSILRFVIFVSSFVVLMKMVEKYPSFKNGGAYWFNDLTAPDSLRVFPVLWTVLLVIRKEINYTETGVSIAKKRMIWMLIACLAIQFMKRVPSAVYCYWITSDVFTLLFDLAIKHPRVKKLLNIEGIASGEEPKKNC